MAILVDINEFKAFKQLFFGEFRKELLNANPKVNNGDFELSFFVSKSEKMLGS